MSVWNKYMNNILKKGLPILIASQMLMYGCNAQDNKYDSKENKQNETEEIINNIIKTPTKKLNHLDSLILELHDENNYLTDQEAINKFPKTIQSIKTEQKKLGLEYKLAKTDSAKNEIIKEAEEYLTNKFIREIYREWEGTNWAFSGYSSRPRKGEIACGWFVERTLENLGYQMEKKKTGRLSQQWPKVSIDGLTENNTIIITDNEKKSKLEQVKELDEGIYIIGFGSLFEDDLGGHIGFLLNSKNNVEIIQSIDYVYASNAKKSDDYFMTSEKLFLGKAFSEKHIVDWLTNGNYDW